MWEGRATPLVHTDSLKEAYLGWLQGMKQGAPFCRPGYRTLRKPGRTLQHNLLLTVSQMAARCQLLRSLTLRSSDPSSGLVNVRAAGQMLGLIRAAWVVRAPVAALRLGYALLRQRTRLHSMRSPSGSGGRILRRSASVTATQLMRCLPRQRMHGSVRTQPASFHPSIWKF